MGVFRDAKNFVNKYLKIGSRTGYSSDLEELGQTFKNHFQDLSDSLEVPALPSLPNIEFGRRESKSGEFSLPLIFVTVLVASLAVNPEVVKYVRGKSNLV